MKFWSLNFYIVIIMGLTFSYEIGNTQTVYMSGPGLTGETDSGPHANQIPLEAYELEKLRYTSYNMEYFLKIRKKIDKTSIDLYSRFDNPFGYSPNDYFIKFYDENDNHYFTMEFHDLQVHSSNIVSPECVNGNCDNHYEEYTFRFAVGCGANCTGYVKYSNIETGESFTFE